MRCEVVMAIIDSISNDLDYMRTNIKEFGYGGVKDDFEYMCDNVRRILILEQDLEV